MRPGLQSGRFLWEFYNQPKETAAVIGEATRRVYAEADGVAVVVAVLKMHIRHVTKVKNIRTFGDIAEAEWWLRGRGRKPVAKRHDGR